jgi:hypothetical protein
MSLEGLRAWIGEVERKLGARTRVFLALAVIAIGLGGAAIYLAIDARESSVSESDVRALQQQLEARIDAVAAGGAATSSPSGEEAAPIEPEAESQAAPTPKSESGAGGGAGAKSGGAGGESSGEATAPPSGATGGAASSAKLQKLFEEAQKKNAEAEAKQAGK